MRSYRAEGLVLRVQPQQRIITVSHGPVRGLMPAMAMPFMAPDVRDIHAVRPGARVRFRIERRGGNYVARRFQPVRDASLDDLAIPVPVGKIAPGDMAPNFALTTHTGAAVSLADFRGRVVCVNFLYTRCPLPEVCPRLASQFARLQRRFDGQADRPVLLSVTLDPEYDTPAVLAEYARKWRADSTSWLLLTGSEAQVKVAASAFGLVYWAEEEAIAHTNATAIIGRDGRLSAVVEGVLETPEQLGDLVAVELARKEGL